MMPQRLSAVSAQNCGRLPVCWPRLSSGRIGAATAWLTRKPPPTHFFRPDFPQPVEPGIPLQSKSFPVNSNRRKGAGLRFTVEWNTQARLRQMRQPLPPALNQIEYEMLSLWIDQLPRLALETIGYSSLASLSIPHPLPYLSRTAIYRVAVCAERSSGQQRPPTQTRRA